MSHDEENHAADSHAAQGIAHLFDNPPEGQKAA